jgi:hypothetical protein
LAAKMLSPGAAMILMLPTWFKLGAGASAA